MRKEYDLADAARGAALKQPGKTRITIMLDRDVLAAFRARAADTGRGYQTAINQALREYLAGDELEDTLRRVVREGAPQGGLSRRYRSPASTCFPAWPAPAARQGSADGAASFGRPFPAPMHVRAAALTGRSPARAPNVGNRQPESAHVQNCPPQAATPRHEPFSTSRPEARGSSIRVTFPATSVTLRLVFC